MLAAARVMSALCAWIFVWSTGSAGELLLDIGQGSQRLSSESLLARPDVRRIQVPDDVSYHRHMEYQAVPLAALLAGLGPGAALQIMATDGFTAEILAASLFATRDEGARAWLAVEDPATPWPALSAGKPSAGPFYLVWTNPSLGGIVPEQWPYQIASIKAVAPATERFVAMLPAPGLPADNPIVRGFGVFRVNCMVCHTMNGQGDASMGPDLNIPYNPTEYLQPAFLQRYIRDPQSLRHWPQARMPAFNEQIMAGDDLQALISYLTHMAGRKQPLPQQPALAK